MPASIWWMLFLFHAVACYLNCKEEGANEEEARRPSTKRIKNDVAGRPLWLSRAESKRNRRGSDEWGMSLSHIRARSLHTLFRERVYARTCARGYVCESTSCTMRTCVRSSTDYLERVVPRRETHVAYVYTCAPPRRVPTEINYGDRIITISKRPHFRTHGAKNSRPAAAKNRLPNVAVNYF